MSEIVILADLIAPFMLDTGGNKSAPTLPAISSVSSSLLSTDHALQIVVAGRNGRSITFTFEILLENSSSLQASLSVVLLNGVSLAPWELLAL